MTLGQMFTACGSDKEWRHWLASTYEREIVLPLRDAEGALCEIGVRVEGSGAGWAGGSLAVWARALPYFTVVGVDRDRDALAALNVVEPRVLTVLADQARPEEIRDALGRLAPAYDVIIDDASHRRRHQKACLAALWPLVRPGGLYVIEDLAAYGQPPDLFDLLAARARAEVMNVAAGAAGPAASYLFCGDAALLRKLA